MGSKAESLADKPTVWTWQTKAEAGKWRNRQSDDMAKVTQGTTADRSTGCPVERAEAARSDCQPGGSAKGRRQNLPQCHRCFSLVRPVFPGIAGWGFFLIP